MSPADIIQGIEEKLEGTSGTDYIFLHEGLGTVGTVIEYILGILVVIAVVGIPIIVALEVLYINVPPLRSTADTILGTKKRGVRIVGLCLRDAIRAIQIADTRDTGESVNMVYFKIKIKTVILAYIIIGLVVGPVNALIAYVGKIVENFLKLF